MSYDMECCYGEHEDFDILVSCPDLCGKVVPSVVTIYHCGQEPPRICACGARYVIEMVGCDVAD